MKMNSEFERIPVSVSLTAVLGHIAPGGAFLGCLYLFEFWAHHSLVSAGVHLPVYTFFQLAPRSSENWLGTTLLGLGLLLGVYITGHVVDAVAALVMDRTLVYRGYGYPFHTLLGYLPRRRANENQHPGGARKRVNIQALSLIGDTRAIHPEWVHLSRNMYRGAFFWLNCYFLIRWMSYASLAFSLPDANTWLRAIANGLGYLGAAFILLKGTVNVRRAKRMRRLIPNRFHRVKRVSWIMAATAAKILASPVSPFASVLSQVLDTRRSFDGQFRALYERQFRRVFSLDPRAAESNNYWFVFAYVKDTSPDLFAVASHWKNLYEFSRNLSTAFYLAALYCLFWISFHSRLVANWKSPGASIVLGIPLALFILAVIMLIHYYYFYVCAYTKFLFRAFVYAAGREEARQNREHGAPNVLMTASGAPMSPGSW